MVHNMVHNIPILMVHNMVHNRSCVIAMDIVLYVVCTVGLAPPPIIVVLILKMQLHSSHKSLHIFTTIWYNNLPFGT